MTTLESRQAEFLSLSDALKRCRGQEFEQHGHRAVVFDRATSPSVRVWGRWAKGERELPCLLRSGERGWFATVVERDEINAPGYELAFWSHRIKVLDLALANALGPYRTLGLLELHVAADTTLALGPCGFAIREALLWGAWHLRAARSEGPPTKAAISAGAGMVDGELGRHALIPTIVKPRQCETAEGRGAP